MDRILNRVRAFAVRHALLAAGDRVVIGVSGGADSVCLLRMLTALRAELGLDLAVVHIDHGLRAESGEDARFVGELCDRLGVPFTLQKYDAAAVAREEKCSVEEAGRQLRYRAFEEKARELGANRIAVAHNADDNCETMLLNLFRGTGVRGLAGIPVRRGLVVRPLLCLERREIEEYMRVCGQEWRTDATNAEDHYTRNRIRHHIMPIAASEINAGCAAHMCQTAEILAETEDYLAQETRRALETCTATESDTSVIMLPAFLPFHPAIRSRVLHELLTALAPGARDIGAVHIRSLAELCEREGNRVLELPFGIRAAREYDHIRLYRADADAAPAQALPSVHMDILDAENLQKPLIFPQNQYTKWFDYGKIKSRLVLRTRREGDYLTISDGQGGTHRKALQDYFTAEKVPPSERDGVPVLADGSHVVWVVGYRISEAYKVREDTRQILQVTVDEGEKHE